MTPILLRSRYRLEAMLSRQTCDGGTASEGHRESAQLRGMEMTTERSSLPQSGRPVLCGLLDLRPRIGAEPSIAPADDAVARGLAVAKVYAFASVDFPGAAESLVFDSDGTTAVGGFTVDPGSNTPLTGFTFTSGTYEILPVPSSTLSVATGIN